MGNWTVTKLVASAEMKARKEYATLEKAFLKAVFRFKTDDSFAFDIPIKELSIAKAKWTFHQERSSFSIVGPAPNGDVGPLMNISFKKETDNWIILIDELEAMKLEVKKML